MAGNPDVAQLRHLLFGKDYDALLSLKNQFEHSDKYSASVASIIAEAITLRNQQDNALSNALAPNLEQALTQSVYQDPHKFADVLYPVMGPAIRKSINQALGEALENLNQLLEQSLSFRSLRWRFDAWRTGQSYAQIVLLNRVVFQVEQVFLIHKETSLLLQHVESPNAISKDPDMVSGMLSAIQDFISDSFEVNRQDTLQTLKLGELTVLVEHGPYAIVAMVVRGTAPSDLHTLLAKVSETIHQQFSPELKAYQGDAAPFSATAPLLAECLKSQQQQKQKHNPWLAWVMLGSVAAILGYWFYSLHQDSLQKQQADQQFKQEQQQAISELHTQLKQQQDHSQRIETLLQNFVDQQNQQTTQTHQQQIALEQKLQTLTQQIQANIYPFELGKADIDAKHPVIQNLTNQMLDLLKTANAARKSVQVTIIGNTDDTGSESLNQRLSQQRADNIRQTLIQQGVPAFMLVSFGANQLSSPLQKNERSVLYQVGLF